METVADVKSNSESRGLENGVLATFFMGLLKKGEKQNKKSESSSVFNEKITELDFINNVPDRRISGMLEYVSEINRNNADLKRENAYLRRSYDRTFSKAVRCEKELIESHLRKQQLEAKINVLETKLATAENDKLLLQNQLLEHEEKLSTSSSSTSSLTNVTVINKKLVEAFETFYEKQAKKFDRSESYALEVDKIIREDSDEDRRSSQKLKLEMSHIEYLYQEYEKSIDRYRIYEEQMSQEVSQIHVLKEMLSSIFAITVACDKKMEIFRPRFDEMKERLTSRKKKILREKAGIIKRKEDLVARKAQLKESLKNLSEDIKNLRRLFVRP